MVLGSLLRFVWILGIHQPFDHVYSDMAGYVGRGVLIATGQELTRYDVFQATGTQTLLALPFAIFGEGRAGMWAAAVLWAGLSSLSVFFCWRLAVRALPALAAVVATALFALWPLAVFSSGYFLADTPALAFLLGGLWLGGGQSRASRLAGGALLAAAAACRPELLVNVLIAAFVFSRRAQPRVLGAIAVGFVAVALPIAVWNSAVARTPTAFSQTAGFVFFQGQCDVQVARGGYASRPFVTGTPDRLQRNAGKVYSSPGTPIYDQGFFVRRALDCIRHDGIGHVRVIADNLAALTATSVPWPAYDDAGFVRETARIVNIAYSLLLPVLLVGAALALRRGRSWLAEPLAHLATPFLVALLFIGEPRYRSLYDVFGLMLLAALVTARTWSSTPGSAEVLPESPSWD